MLFGDSEVLVAMCFAVAMAVVSSAHYRSMGSRFMDSVAILEWHALLAVKVQQ